MQDLIAETSAVDIEGVCIKLALFVYMSGVDPETTDSAVEQVLLSAYKDCVRALGRDLLAEVKRNRARYRGLLVSGLNLHFVLGWNRGLVIGRESSDALIS
ncbi:MAG: hypothetical protein WBW99_12740 [Pseudolabrys sp.]